MITFLPLLNGETGEAQPKSRTEMIEPEMLRGYPRIQSAFTVDEPDGLHKCQRVALIQQIKKNIGNKPGWLRSHLRVAAGPLRRAEARTRARRGEIWARTLPFGLMIV